MGRTPIICEHGVVGKSRCGLCQSAYGKAYRAGRPLINRVKRPSQTRFIPQEVVLGVAKENTARRKALCQAFVAWLKSGLNCTDCGLTFHPIIMEFDHREPATKYKSIATLAGSGQRRKLLEELPKTDLVCRPCHHVRTRSRYKIKGYARA